MGSPTSQQVLLKLLGSEDEVAIAKEIQKAIKQIPTSGVRPRTPSVPPPGLRDSRQAGSVVCFNCSRRGHIASSCWRPKSFRKNRGGRKM